MLAIARFCGDEVFVGVISGEDRDVKIRLPLGAVGAKRPKWEIFGREMEFTETEPHAVELTVKAHRAYFMECELL